MNLPTDMFPEKEMKENGKKGEVEYEKEYNLYIVGGMGRNKGMCPYYEDY